jgi:hypothetical protein
MSIRTTTNVVRFDHPFLLPGFDLPQPAGEYRVDVDEERMEGNLGHAWRAIGGFIHLPAIGVPTSMLQMVPIETGDIEVALQKDRNP